MANPGEVVLEKVLAYRRGLEAGGAAGKREIKAEEGARVQRSGRFRCVGCRKRW